MENKNLPQLCDANTCMGCGSCAQSCAHEAITMSYNAEGYYNPVVNADRCVGCHQCEKHCPILTPVVKHEEEPLAYAVWNKDDEIRKQSSSGGAFTSIAEPILDEGGLVWGAGYSADMKPIYMCIEHKEDLNLIRGSKYVQCEIGDTFKKIRAQLKDGNKVLFCGTPCHVAGLHAFLQGKFVENLITVDFICHGVPSSKLFGNYIQWLENKYKDKVTRFNFRESKFGINYNVATSATFRNAGKKYLYLNDNSYTLGFCRDITIHDACSLCHFRGQQRHADFTIGDFHGEKKRFNSKEQYKGISTMIVNNKTYQLCGGGV